MTKTILKTVYADTNLINNASVETVSSGDPTLPDGWHHDGYGNNNVTFNYPVTGYQSEKAINITITSYSSGDAKWYFQDVSVIPGQTYLYTDYYKATVESDVTVRYTLADNSNIYTYLGTVPAASNWTQASYAFTVPSNVVSLSVYRVIARQGTLTTDDFSLVQVGGPTPTPTITPTPTLTITPTPTPIQNLITNGDLEISNGDVPDGWIPSSWGSNNAVFTYPAVGVSNSKGVRIDITSYSSGDAKWYFQDVPVTPGSSYTFKNTYQSSASSEISIRYLMTNGSYQYQWVGILGPASTWTNYQYSFTVPTGVQKLTIYHLLAGIGSLTVDNYSLNQTVDPTKFTEGRVSFDFDDGAIEAYQNGAPILNTAGIKGTFYIITGYTNVDNNYMTSGNILSLQSAGHEIGNHTRTHPHLYSIPLSQVITEISGAKSDLLNMGVTSVTSLAYPFGDYNNSVINIARSYGMTMGRSVDAGFNDKNTNPMALYGNSYESTTTVDSIKTQIDQAIAQKKWLIMVFHRIDNTGDQWSLSPAKLQQVVDYVKQTGVKVVTAREGVADMVN